MITERVYDPSLPSAPTSPAVHVTLTMMYPILGDTFRISIYSHHNVANVVSGVCVDM